jgi:hypothetical protein
MFDRHLANGAKPIHRPSFVPYRSVIFFAAALFFGMATKASSLSNPARLNASA